MGMMERENVIKSLEYCKNNQHVNDCNKCDYGVKTGMFCIRMIDDVLAMLKEQEAEIRQLRLALDIAKGTCKGIKSGGGQFVDMPTMQSAT